MKHFNKIEQSEILEIARVGLAMNFTEIAEMMDLSDEYLSDLRDKIIENTDGIGITPMGGDTGAEADDPRYFIVPDEEDED